MTTPCERDHEIDDLEEQARDHDRRVLTLETNFKVIEAEINSLRASRHEQSNWLNRHNLEISELRMKMAEMAGAIQILISKADKMDNDFTTLQLSITTQLAAVKSDLRQTMWIVSLVVGILVFVGRAVANHYGF